MRCECCDDCTDRHSQIVKNLVSNGRFTLSWATRAGFINLFFFQLQHGFVCHFVIYKNHECWCRANRGPNKRQSCILQCAQTKNRLKKKHVKSVYYPSLQYECPLGSVIIRILCSHKQFNQFHCVLYLSLSVRSRIEHRIHCVFVLLTQQILFPPKIQPFRCWRR